MSTTDLDARVQKAALLADLEEARARFQEALARVPPEAYERSGAAGRWSLKDVLLHMSAWWGLALEALELLSQGKGAAHPFEVGDVDRWNEEQVRAQAHKGPEEALQEFHAREEAVAEVVVRTPPEVLAADPAAFQHLRRVLVYHYEEHLPDVERAVTL